MLFALKYVRDIRFSVCRCYINALSIVLMKCHINVKMYPIIMDPTEAYGGLINLNDSNMSFS